MCCDIHDGVNLADLTHFLAMAAAIFRAVGNTTRLQLIYQYTSHVHSSTQYSSTTVLPYHTIPGQVQVTVSVAVPALWPGPGPGTCMYVLICLLLGIGSVEQFG